MANMNKCIVHFASITEAEFIGLNVARLTCVDELNKAKANTKANTPIKTISGIHFDAAKTNDMIKQ